MEADELHALARSMRRTPARRGGAQMIAVDYGRAEIERILPHRDPFLHIDAITEIDLAHECIVGRRAIDRDDPVFRGHFPGDPVYPGVLLVESVAQMGLCLVDFVARGTVEVDPHGPRMRLRATRVHHALFEAPVRPGDALTLCSRLVESDDLRSLLACQIYRDETLCAVALVETCFIDGEQPGA